MLPATLRTAPTNATTMNRCGFHHRGRGLGRPATTTNTARMRYSALKGEGAFVNVLSDFAHTGFAGALLAHPRGLDGHDNEAENGQTWNE